MTLEGVPWAVNLASHSAEVARLLAYAAVGGGEGVVGPGDFKVTPSGTPDGNIHIAPGGLACLNRFAGGGQQTYLLRNTADEVKAMTPQGSGGVRYDLVCIIVQDPQYAGQPAPVSVPNGPYIKVQVYENVASTVKSITEVAPNQTGYALARVKFDASDGTVTAADITDLREMVQPRTKVVKKIINQNATAALPGALGVAPAAATWDIPIPSWATKVLLEAQWSGVKFTDGGAGNGSASGTARVDLGTIQSATTSWSQDATAASKPVTDTIFVGDDQAVAAGLRGTTQTLSAKLAKTGGSGMTAQTTPGTVCMVTATFYEELT